MALFPTHLLSLRNLTANGTLSLAGVLLLVATLSVDPGAGVDEFGAMKLLRGGLVYTALILLLPYVVKLRLRRFRTCTVLLYYLIFCWVSVLWSVHPLASLGKVAELSGGALVAFAAASCNAPLERLRRLRNAVLLASFVEIAIALGGALAHLPGWFSNRPGLFGNITVSTPFVSGNGFGYAVGIGLTVVITLLVERQIGRWEAALLLAALLFALPFASSRTTLGVLAVTLLFLAAKRSYKIAASVALGGAIALFLGWTVVLHIFLQNRSMSSFESLSGRTYLWNLGLDEWKHHFLFGAGYGVGTKDMLKTISSFSSTMTSVHNGFIELACGTGLVGVILFGLLFFRVTVRCLRYWKRFPLSRSNYILIFCFFGFSIMSTGVAGWLNELSLLFFVTIAQMDVEADLFERASLARADAVGAAYG